MIILFGTFLPESVFFVCEIVLTWSFLSLFYRAVLKLPLMVDIPLIMQP